MQKRFCSCGQEIWVQYLLSLNNLQALFTHEPHGGNLLITCPHCGEILSIHNLL